MPSRSRALRLLMTTAVALASALPGAAHAAGLTQPACPGVKATATTFATAGLPLAGWTENLGFDGYGGMWVSELNSNLVVRYDADGKAGRSVALSSPGAVLPGPDGQMYAVFGDTTTAGVLMNHPGGVARFDPLAPNPVAKVLVKDLPSANGAAFDHDGNLYISNTGGTGIIKMRRDGTLDAAFTKAAALSGANGLAVRDGNLYAALITDPMSSIVRVPLTHPERYKTVAQLSLGADGSLVPKLLDDMQFGPDGRLYVGATIGELLRVDVAKGTACVVYNGVPITSVRFAEAFDPFDRNSDAFLTSEAGTVTRLHITPRLKTAPVISHDLHLAVTPRRIARGRPVTLHFKASSQAPQCRAQATVTFAGRSRRTDSAGRTSMRVRLNRAGRRTATVRHDGCTSGITLVRVSG